MVFMLLPYLTIQMFKAVWLFMLPLAFHHHTPHPSPRGHGADGCPTDGCTCYALCVTFNNNGFYPLQVKKLGSIAWLMLCY